MSTRLQSRNLRGDITPADRVIAGLTWGIPTGVVTGLLAKDSALGLLAGGTVTAINAAFPAPRRRGKNVREILLKKQAGTEQASYAIKGKHVYRTIESTQPFEGASQPDPEVKYFKKTKRIKDFAEQEALKRRFKMEDLATFKKAASVSLRGASRMEFHRLLARERQGQLNSRDLRRLKQLLKAYQTQLGKISQPKYINKLAKCKKKKKKKYFLKKVSWQVELPKVMESLQSLKKQQFKFLKAFNKGANITDQSREQFRINWLKILDSEERLRHLTAKAKQLG